MSSLFMKKTSSGDGGLEPTILRICTGQPPNQLRQLLLRFLISQQWHKLFSTIFISRINFSCIFFNYVSDSNTDFNMR